MSEVSSSNTVVNDYSTLFRTYDARTGRWTSHDPILQPWESTYSGLSGNPAMLTDWYGLSASKLSSPLLPASASADIDFGMWGQAKDQKLQVSKYTAPSSILLFPVGVPAPYEVPHTGPKTQDRPLIFLPEGTPSSGKYKIKQGDNFWKLEKRWGLESGELSALNPGVDPEDVKPGDEIITDPDRPVNEPFQITVTRTKKVKRETRVLQARAIPLPFPTTARPFVPISGSLLEKLLDAVISPPAPTVYYEDVQVEEMDEAPFWYVVYEKFNPTTGQVYTGRTSGYGRTPDEVVKRRDQGHKDKDAQGFGPAKVFLGLPATKSGGYRNRLIDPSYWAIRGVEQMRIDRWRSLGRSANKINGISPKNQYIDRFLEEAVKYIK